MSVLLDWENPSKFEDDLLQKNSFDLMLASDCVYGVAAVPSLCQTLDYYLSETGVFIMSYKLRWFDVDRSLRETLEKMKFKVVEIPLIDFIPLELINDEIKHDGFLFVITRRV